MLTILLLQKLLAAAALIQNVTKPPRKNGLTKMGIVAFLAFIRKSLVMCPLPEGIKICREHEIKRITKLFHISSAIMENNRL